MMASSKPNVVASQRLASINRHFSTSPTRAAAEVKKIGVIGAGQMVSALLVNKSTWKQYLHTHR